MLYKTALHDCSPLYDIGLLCREDRLQRVYRLFQSLVRRRPVQPGSDAHPLPFRAHGEGGKLSF